MSKNIKILYVYFCGFKKFVIVCKVLLFVVCCKIVEGNMSKVEVKIGGIILFKFNLIGM